MDKEKLNSRYDEHSDTIIPELLVDDAHYRQLVKKKNCRRICLASNRQQSCMESVS